MFGRGEAKGAVWTRGGIYLAIVSKRDFFIDFEKVLKL